MSVLQTIGSGTRIVDPQGVAGHFVYRAESSFGGSLGRFEVLVNENLGVNNHVMFTSAK